MRRPLALLAIAAMASCTGCAVCHRQNRPTLNWVEANAVPKKAPARTLALPGTIPLKAIALGLDAAIVHPATRVRQALKSTRRDVWAPDTFEWDEQPLVESAMLAPRALVTPLVCTGNFVELAWLDTHRTRPPEAPSAPAPKP